MGKSKEEGIKEGIKEGSKDVVGAIRYLFSRGRGNEVEDFANNTKFREQVLAEYLTTMKNSISV